MKRRLRHVLVAMMLVALSAPVSADSTEHQSTLADQRSVSVTIYNSDLALVRDDRRVVLPRGRSRLALRDVSAQIQPETALLRSLAAHNTIDVLEQNFDYDLLSPAKLLEKYVGRTVSVVHTNVQSGERTRESARILADTSGIVLQYADRIETTVDGTIAFPTIPGELRDRPTLTIDLDNSDPRPQSLELTYLTSGLSWRADYVGQLSADAKHLDLDASITLQNASGTTYQNAALALVAGDVNVATSGQYQPSQTADTYSVSAAAPRPVVSTLSEYHLYNVPRPTTIADRQTKQVALLSAHAVPVAKSLELSGASFYYGRSFADLGTRLAVGSYLTFKNEQGELGIPLPGGIVRIYQQDASGHSQFIGSDGIGHTPKRETVRLYLGTSFDVTARKKQTDYSIVSDTPRVSQSSYQIVISNAKETAETVLVTEPIPGDWSITAESAPHQKTSSGTASWTVPVPPNGSTTLSYTARVRF